MLRTTEPQVAVACGDGSPAPSEQSAKGDSIAVRAVDSSEPSSSGPASSALTPSVDGIGEASAPPLADVGIAANVQPGLMGVLTHTEADTAEAAPAAQPAAAEPDGDLHKQVQQASDYALFSCC